MYNMKVYQTVKESPLSNTIVKELNAAVLTTTFKGKGQFKADLYNNTNSCACLVLKGGCAPINSEYVNTVLININ